jgi:alpha-amylase
MSNPISLDDIDLRPIPGKQYFNSPREWREEFIYFLMADRFHDGRARTAVNQAGRSNGFAAPDGFYGGTIQGITQNLDYIAGLGCTAIWISPVLENNANAYHGYNINNYLGIDPHFGTKQDLIDLVDAAHGHRRNGQPWPLRIILDVVINHSGDNWTYSGDQTHSYDHGRQFDFGRWRRADRPIPTELQNPDWYHRRGDMQDYDNPPENQYGDMSGLKDYANQEDDPAASAVVNALIKSYCYWIREADVDGFRVDAVKHMSVQACAWFCSNIREYAYSLGKRGFFLYGEVATPSDDLYNRYLGPNTSVQSGSTVFFGLDSVLDFRLAEGGDGNAGLPAVLKGFAGPETLFNRLEAQRQRALNRAEIGRYLVTFVDNHDSFWQPFGRFGNGADDDQVIGAIGFLLCSLGTPCIYYGTEQGFSGFGGDVAMREGMFDRAGNSSLMNVGCRIYQEIGKIAAVMRSEEPLRFGRMYYRQISGDGENFGFPFGNTYTLALSRMLYGREILVAYNVAEQPRQDAVVVDSTLWDDGAPMAFLYGGAGSTPVRTAADGTRFVRLNLAPHQFVVLG